MKTSYTTLIQSIATKNFSDAERVFREVMEQKVADRLVRERQGLAGRLYEETTPEPRKCKSCGKSFTPSNGEYARCKSCFDKQTTAGEIATSGRFSEALNEAKLECQECGKRFTKSVTAGSDPKCPKCGGYDVELVD